MTRQQSWLREISRLGNNNYCLKELALDLEHLLCATGRKLKKKNDSTQAMLTCSHEGFKVFFYWNFQPVHGSLAKRNQKNKIDNKKYIILDALRQVNREGSYQLSSQVHIRHRWELDNFGENAVEWARKAEIRWAEAQIQIQI